VAGLELAPELVDRVLERSGRVIGQLAGLPDRVEDAGSLARDVAEELGLEPADVTDRNVIELTGSAGPHRDHFTLDRVRAVLALLKQLDQAGTAIELGPGRGV